MVDYLKFDDCGAMNLASYAKFSVMRDSIAATGRKVIYSFEPYTGPVKIRTTHTHTHTSMRHSYPFDGCPK